MAGYSQSERNLMRQDAIRRAREMRHGDAPPPHPGVQAPPPRPDPPPKPPPMPPPPKPHGALGGFPLPDLNLSALIGGLDSEKITILAVLVLLAREGADIKLLAALGYVML